jgi:hypothetical protein
LSKALELAEEVRDAWSQVDAPPVEDMEYFTKGWGRRVEQLFVGVPPSAIDIDAPKFLSEGPLNELAASAASAYLGPYLRAFLTDLAFQERVGMPTEPMLRAHVVSFLTYPRTWTDQLEPQLSRKCKAALRNVTEYILQSRNLLCLTERQIHAFERLRRNIDQSLEA